MLINERNKPETENQFILISTCDNIEYTKVWYLDNPESRIPHCYAFIYFIKDENGEYVGSVQKMEDGDCLFLLRSAIEEKESRFPRWTITSFRIYVQRTTAT